MVEVALDGRAAVSGVVCCLTDIGAPTNIGDLMRIAWFSPLPPTRSGVSAYSAELLPLLESPTIIIDRYPESSAHDFVWKARRQQYDLVVYQMGNAPCHDYMWGYLARYPGLVVLHDARLHHARARRLLQQRRYDDYRREFEYDHPDARPEFADYAIAGLGGAIYYFWPMLRVVMRTARLVAVHSARVADELSAEYPDVAIESLRMGVARTVTDGTAREATRHRLGIPTDGLAFVVFGRVTAEKRIGAILRAVGTLVREGRDAFLVIVGDAAEYPTLEKEISENGINGRVSVTGHVDDSLVGPHLAAADACLCLRWPTAQETSASWLRCLSAGKPTVITDLPHLVDVPPAVAMKVDLLDEELSLQSAMRRLADQRFREAYGRTGRDWWEAHHTLELMAADYRRVIAAASARHPTAPPDLPRHFLEDYAEPARQIAGQFGVALDLFDVPDSRGRPQPQG